MENGNLRRVAVLGGSRIPFARQNGPYAQASNQDMLTATLDAWSPDSRSRASDRRGRRRRGAQAQPRLQPHPRVGARLAARAPRRPPTTSSRRAAPASRRRSSSPTRSRSARSTPGSPAASTPPPTRRWPSTRTSARSCSRLNRTKSNTGRLKLLARLRPGQLVPEIPRNAEPRTGLSMGEHAAIMAREWGIGREEQDELAVASHHNLAAAYDSGWLDDLVVPFLGLERDQNLRPDSSLEKLAKLKPVFGGPEGTMTAGNSTPLTDGASTVLLASEEWAKAHGIPVQAYFSTAQTAAVDYVHKREGLLMAPAYAMPEDARPRRPDAAGLRLLRDPRGVRRAGAVHAEGVGGPGVLLRATRPRRAARLDRPRQAQRPRRLARRRATRSAPPAGGSSPAWPRRWPSAAPAAA